MKIQVEYYENAVFLTFEGRFGGPDYAELNDKLIALFKKDIFNIVLELSGEVYLHSAVTRVIIAAVKECRNNGGDIRIANPSQPNSETLQLVGLDEPFLIYQDKVEALNSFKVENSSAASV